MQVKEVAPIIADYWERAEFPHELVPKCAPLNLGGGTLSGNGCPGLSVTEFAMVRFFSRLYTTGILARVNLYCSSYSTSHVLSVTKHYIVHACTAGAVNTAKAPRSLPYTWIPELLPS